MDCVRAQFPIVGARENPVSSLNPLRVKDPQGRIRFFGTLGPLQAGASQADTRVTPGEHEIPMLPCHPPQFETARTVCPRLDCGRGVLLCAAMAMVCLRERGDVLARKFRLVGVVGRGSHGVVWRAQHLGTMRPLALKIVQVPDTRTRERFVREAQSACAVQDPCVLPVEDIQDLGGGELALVMPLLIGESLRARLERTGPLPMGDLRRLFVPLLEAVVKVHAKGIVHRDIKPENLFVQRDPERLILLDFGLARMREEERLRLSSTGAPVGTPLYMSPEQAWGEQEIDARADAWSLALTLLECATGDLPTRCAQNFGQLLRLFSDHKVLPFEVNSLPSRLREGIASCLRSARGERAGIDGLLRALGDSPPVLSEASWAFDRIVRKRRGIFAFAGAVSAVAFACMIHVFAGAPRGRLESASRMTAGTIRRLPLVEPKPDATMASNSNSEHHRAKDRVVNALRPGALQATIAPPVSKLEPPAIVKESPY
jgi:serine/threonine protein kinase